jgi:diadenosine tetraphosphate (Ap4A) HIT family hydrolase
MSDVDEWAQQQTGIGCYLCQPRLSANKAIRQIAPLSISNLYLTQDQRFLGHSTLIFDARHATRVDELSDSEYAKYMHDLRLSVQAICAALNPDHVNVAMLGNSCPHLHWGIVPRYRTDPSWGRPIWEGTTVQEVRRNPMILAEPDCAGVISRIRNELQRLSL